jgi:hypothetical protein
VTIGFGWRMKRTHKQGGRWRETPTGMKVFLLGLRTVAVLALEAKWTPAGDGPARFSKRYRDAQGIDDSRWYGSDNLSSLPAFLPQSPEGWVLAMICGAVIAYLYRAQQLAMPGGERLGAGTDAPARKPSEAQEAARAAFLKRYEQQHS